MMIRWFALIRIWTPWLAPRQGQSHFELDKEAIVCSFLERLGGRHIVLLAVSGVDDVITTFKSDPEGNVTLQVCISISGPTHHEDSIDQSRFAMTVPKQALPESSSLSATTLNRQMLRQCTAPAK
jgi:hypothetical protein